MFNTAGLDDTEVAKYFTPIWFQYSYNEETGETDATYYQAVNCMETAYIQSHDITEQTKNEIWDQKCADREDVKIQNGVRANQSIYKDNQYFFAVDTCAHMKNVTGLDLDCYTQDESLALIDRVFIQNKVST